MTASVPPLQLYTHLMQKLKDIQSLLQTCQQSIVSDVDNAMSNEQCSYANLVALEKKIKDIRNTIMDPLQVVLKSLADRASKLRPKSSVIETPITVLVVADIEQGLHDAVTVALQNRINKTVDEQHGVTLQAKCTVDKSETALSRSRSPTHDVVVLLVMFNETRLPESIVGKPKYDRQRDGELLLERLRALSASKSVLMVCVTTNASTADISAIPTHVTQQSGLWLGSRQAVTSTFALSVSGRTPHSASLDELAKFIGKLYKP